jgi:transposase
MGSSALLMMQGCQPAQRFSFPRGFLVIQNRRRATIIKSAGEPLFGIRRDEAAVQAAVTQTWSNGPVEGHVNRLKTIKRQMYGRAGFVLLRARVLNVA